MSTTISVSRAARISVFFSSGGELHPEQYNKGVVVSQHTNMTFDIGAPTTSFEPLFPMLMMVMMEMHADGLGRGGGLVKPKVERRPSPPQAQTPAPRINHGMPYGMRPGSHVLAHPYAEGPFPRGEAPF